MNNLKLLNELLTRNYDAEKGFKKAAEMTDNGALKTYYKKNAQMHYDFGHQLKAEIKKLGALPDKGSSVEADMHRSWMDIKAFVSSDSEEAIVEECERGQKEALDDYQKAMVHLDVEHKSARNTVDRQLTSIKNSVDKLKQIEINVA